MRRHCFRNNRYILYIIPPILRIPEHFRRMDIPYHIIYISIINDNLGNTGFNKTTFQIFQSVADQRYDFSAWNNTISYFYS